MDFNPRYIMESELATFGLPTPDQQANIVNLVDGASVLIDEYCGRVEVTGNGSLVYSTYTEALFLPEGRPIIRLSYRPVVAIPASVVSALSTSANSGALDSNFLYTGVQANTLLFQQSTLSPIISCSGSYGFSRRGSSLAYPSVAFPGPLELFQLSNFFGGPPVWNNIDPTNLSFDPRTGELHIPIGLYPINEILVTYNSGFDPTHMPRAVKFACAAIVKNFLAKGGTGVRSLSGAGGVNVVMDPMLIDANVEIWLRNYKTEIAA